VTPVTTLVADPPWPFADKLPGAGRGAVKHYRTLTIPEIMRFPLPDLAADARLFLWRVGSMQSEALEVVRAWGFVVKTDVVWIKAEAGHAVRAGDASLEDRRKALGWSVVQLGQEVLGELLEPRVVRRVLRDDFADPINVARVTEALSRGERDRAEATMRVQIGMGRQVRNAHEVCIVATRGRPDRLDLAASSVVIAPRLAHSAKPDAFYDLVERVSPGPYAELFARRERPGWDVYGDEIEVTE